MPFSIKKIYSSSFFSMGIFFILFFCLLLISFCAYSIHCSLLLNISIVIFFIYALVIWIFLDTVTVWAIILSSILYFTFIPGINIFAGITLLSMTCAVHFMFFINNRALTSLEKKESALRTDVIRKRRSKQIYEIKNLMEKILRLGQLKNMSERLPKGYDKKAIIDYVISYTSEIIGKGSLIRIYLLDPDMKALSVAAKRWISEPKLIFPENDCISRYILNKGSAVLVNDIEQDKKFNLSSDFPFKSIAAVPIMDIERVYGIIRIDSVYKNIFTLSDQKSLVNIAHLAGLAINNARLYSLKLKLAVTDSLTGLKTHAFFKDSLDKLIQNKKKFCIIFIDVDDFKRVNDTYGHVVGDKVLIYISKKINDIQADITARYGGEEFSLIIKNINLETGVKTAENIRKSIESLHIVIRRKKVNITVSIGVAVYPKSAASAETIMRKVDHAMYMAKNKGKNRIEAVL